MRNPQDEWRVELILPLDIRTPTFAGFEDAVWEPWCGLCASYHSIVQDPCDALLRLRNSSGLESRKVCPVGKHPPDGSCDCAQRVYCALTRQERERRRRQWQDHFPRAGLNAPTWLLTVSTVRPSRNNETLDVRACDVADLLLVDSGASLHLEVGIEGFGDMGKTSLEIDVNIGQMVVCDTEGNHVMFLIGGPPAFKVLQLTRTKTLCCRQARRPLFSVRSAVLEHKVNVFFDEAPHIQFPDGTHVPFLDIDGEYALPRFHDCHAAERAAAKLRNGLQLHAWVPRLEAAEKGGNNTALERVHTFRAPVKNSGALRPLG